MKKMLALLLVLMLCLGAMPVLADAEPITPPVTPPIVTPPAPDVPPVVTPPIVTPPAPGVPRIKTTEYKGNGRVELDFQDKVRYHRVMVEVKDIKGTIYPAIPMNRDSDDLTFRVKGYAVGQKYTFEITGVRTRKATEFGILRGEFIIPEPSVPDITAVIYEAEDNELTVQFEQPMRMKGIEVTIADEAGTEVSVRRVKKGGDELTVKMSEALEPDTVYEFVISGLKVADMAELQSITGSFVTDPAEEEEEEEEEEGEEEEEEEEEGDADAAQAK
ncbi:MAG: Ig-like domain-containing protein [Clostridia bacterium]